MLEKLTQSKFARSVMAAAMLALPSSALSADPAAAPAKPKKAAAPQFQGDALTIATNAVHALNLSNKDVTKRPGQADRKAWNEMRRNGNAISTYAAPNFGDTNQMGQAFAVYNRNPLTGRGERLQLNALYNQKGQFVGGQDRLGTTTNFTYTTSISRSLSGHSVTNVTKTATFVPGKVYGIVDLGAVNDLQAQSGAYKALCEQVRKLEASQAAASAPGMPASFSLGRPTVVSDGYLQSLYGPGKTNCAPVKATK